MGITLLDYSPIYRSLQSRAYADRASLMPEQNDINRQFAKLQSEERTRQAITGIAESGLALAKGVYGIMEQGEMEKAKAATYQMRLRLEDQYKSDVYNNKLTPVTAEDGSVRFEESPETKSMMEGFRAEIGERFKGFSRVAGWATAQVEGAYQQAHEWALGQKYSQATEDRQKAFLSNLGEAIKAGVSEGNYAPVQAQIEQATYLTPEKKALAEKAAYYQVDYGIAKNKVLAIGVKSGIDEGLAAVDGLKGFEPTDIDQMKKDLATQEKELDSATKGSYLKTFQDRLKNGDTVESIRSDLQAAPIPPDRKAKAMAEVDNLQTALSSINAYELYNQDRDDPSKLMLDYKRIKNGDMRDSFAGIDKAHKAVLDMFEERLGIVSPKPATAAEKKETADRMLDYTFESYSQGQIDFANAKSLTEMYGAQANPGKMGTYMGKLKTLVPSQYKEMFSKLDSVAASTYLSSIGKKDDKDLTAEQRLKLGELQGYMAGLALDIVQESKKDGMTPAILGERINGVVQTYLGKEYTILREGIIEKGKVFGLFGGQTVDEGAARFQALLDSKSSMVQDLVFQDTNGETRYAPGAKEKLQALYDYQQGRAEAALGTKLVRNLERDGQDVTAQAVFSNPDTKVDYRFRASADQKTSELLYRTPGGGWKPYVAKSPQPAPNPASPAPPTVSLDKIASGLAALTQKKRASAIQAYIDSGTVTEEDLQKLGYKLDGSTW